MSFICSTTRMNFSSATACVLMGSKVNVDATGPDAAFFFFFFVLLPAGFFFVGTATQREFGSASESLPTDRGGRSLLAVPLEHERAEG